MSAGIQPTQASINQQAGNLAVTLRDTMDAIKNFQAWIGAFGGHNALVSQLGFQLADAQTIESTFTNLDQLRQAYQGITTIPATFNFEANSQALWGGI